MPPLENKENVAPLTSSDPLAHRISSPVKKKGRSKSIGPGDIVKTDNSIKQDAKNRRKSAFVPASKSIISTDAEKAERQAARRRTLANRRVSFAPEATLHTWDVIEFQRDQTTSTDSSDQTRRSGTGGTPFQQSNPLSSDDEDPPSTPPEQEGESETIPASPAVQGDVHKKQRRRSSGIPPMNFNNPEDEFSSSGVSGSSDVSGSEDEMDGDESEDATGTAMSLDAGEETVQSSESGSSTSSSLTMRLQEAAQLAGTRGIEYDEHGEGDMSMEIAGEEITNAFQPWAQKAAIQAISSASLDQENVNPFSPAFKAQIVSGKVSRPSTIAEEETGDLSMDVTRAVGGIVRAQVSQQQPSSPPDDGTMDFTQAMPKILVTGQKRRRSTTAAGSPSTEEAVAPKRSRRSSVARSSMGDDTMDLTMAVGGIQDVAPPTTAQRRKSVARRRSSGVALEQDDATMDFTQAIGGIKAAAARAEHTTSSIDENEELTMELTTVLGGIKAAAKLTIERPATPEQPQSPARDAANTTPKDQERFTDVLDSGLKKLLTPLFQKQVKQSAEKGGSSDKRRQSIQPSKISWTGAVFDETQEPQPEIEIRFEPVQERLGSPLKNEVRYPELSLEEELVSPSRESIPRTPPSGRTVHQQLLDEQLSAAVLSPIVEKVLRSSPARAVLTPERHVSASQEQQPNEARSVLIDSIRLLTTPRKDSLKNVTPKKSAGKQMSPVKHTTPRPRPTPKSPAVARSSPARQLSDDLLRVDSNEQTVEKVQLQSFLEDAGIRFMDLTATKRRMTTVPTPSKARKNTDTEDASEQAEPEINLELAIVAAACSQPEHDMFQHACHELKHYISEGKKVIKQLETQTYRETPPLIRAYANASSERKAVLDAQMRDMKTHARFRSKEMWYHWRSQLLEDLMKALSSIGEGLLRDDEVLVHAEEVLQGTLPGLMEQRMDMQVEMERLEAVAAAMETSEEEKEELEGARGRLVEVDGELEEKMKVFEGLRREAQEQEGLATDMQDSKLELTAAIQEAERVRDACRGVSLKEIAALKDSVTKLEETYGWSITSASSYPPTVTMSYRSQLQLFFHPAAFHVQSQSAKSRPNATISLVYIAQDRNQQPKELTTTLRFFLQLLRANLQALPQSSTRVPDLLGLVSSGWDTALKIAEAERRLNIETLTTSRIVSDERLAVESTVLLPAVRTKVRVSYELLAAVGEGMQLSTTLEAAARVVYGEQYNEAKMTKFVNERVGDVAEGWSGAVREMREKLIATGAKGFRK
ncbi:hypothetical protein LTR97_005121 [Elasticomyces elasticus]|uniref:Spc7 kinetochore protein domain-containing protein n=1 Tax=Elasticomyces elasticus TaxID=574655 RepID=A0AAN7ZNR1_9PEZI|nr:hypothetical protein LTR97_005121 [Elasticomyces elasticus]